MSALLVVYVHTLMPSGKIPRILRPQLLLASARSCLARAPPSASYSPGNEHECLFFSVDWMVLRIMPRLLSVLRLFPLPYFLLASLSSRSSLHIHLFLALAHRHVLPARPLPTIITSLTTPTFCLSTSISTCFFLRRPLPADSRPRPPSIPWLFRRHRPAHMNTSTSPHRHLHPHVPPQNIPPTASIHAAHRPWRSQLRLYIILLTALSSQMTTDSGQPFEESRSSLSRKSSHHQPTSSLSSIHVHLPPSTLPRPPRSEPANILECRLPCVASSSSPPRATRCTPKRQLRGTRLSLAIRFPT